MSPLQQHTGTGAASNGGAGGEGTLKYGPQPGGGDIFKDFVTLVCQEAHNAQQVSEWLMSIKWK